MGEYTTTTKKELKISLYEMHRDIIEIIFNMYKTYFIYFALNQSCYHEYLNMK